MTRILDGSGRVTGMRLFLGLFAAAAYNRNPRSIPLLRGKVERILATAGVSPFSHDGRALRNILDTWPRDELFQASEDARCSPARASRSTLRSARARRSSSGPTLSAASSRSSPGCRARASTRGCAPAWARC
jgi:NAD-specific glutamate dehydrogenase